MQPSGRVRHAEPPAHPDLHAGDAGARRRPCASASSTTLARRAFRRPPTEDDIDELMQMYAVGREDGSFEDGIRTAVQAHHRAARVHLPLRARARRRRRAGQNLPHRTISSWRRGSRISCGAPAPTTRYRRRGQGELKTPAVLEQQVKRMLADRRAESLSTHFAAQWLRLHGPGGGPSRADDLSRTSPGTSAQSMRREVELLFDSIVREDRSIARPAHRRLHLRERGAGQALRHPQRRRAAVPPRDGHRPEPLRPARPWRHPDA